MHTFSGILEDNTPRFDRLGIAPGTVAKLKVYLERLWAANQELNLISRKMTAEALVLDHLFDSLIALPHFPRAKVVADLGSGGGLPAIPLAACFPERHFILFEKSPRKCAFLKSLSDVVPNTVVYQGFEEKGFPSEIDLVVARAFKPIQATLDLTRRYYRSGGRYLLYKGRKRKINQELETARLPASSYRILELQSVGDAEERHLVLIN